METCPVCGNSEVISEYAEFTHPSGHYVLSKCPQCTGIFYKTNNSFDFKNNSDHNKSSKIYLEKTSDVEEQVTIAYNFFNQLPDKVKGIDIGCGGGIVMDFSQEVMSREIIGFEPSSSFSNEIKHILGLTIIEDFFSVDKLETQSLDFTICLQVLQLIKEPKTLLQDVKKLLKRKGVALFSTPDNESLELKKISSESFSVLSPGVHQILFNAKCIEQALVEAGFSYIKVFKRNGQLFALASNSEPVSFDIFKPNRKILLDYYESKLKQLPNDTSYFRGIWYRLYRNRIDHGEYKEALEMLKNANWFEVWLESEIENIYTSDKLYELNSFSDAVIYYYTGILFLNYLHKINYAEKFFNLSFLLCKKIIQLQSGMDMIERDIVWLAKLHSILAKLYQGKSENVKGELMLIISDGAKSDFLPPSSAEVKMKAQKLLEQMV
jgi:SAM-dependent methyltransferase